LADYVDYHFAREEEMLKAANYADFNAHIQEHRDFSEWFFNAKSAVEINPETALHLSYTVTEYLQKWLKEHIFHTDMAYKGKI